MGSWLWKHTRSQPAVSPVRDGDRDPDGIVTAVAPAERDIVIHKQKPSAFLGTPLQSYLTLLQADTIVVAGCTTSGCVRATVVDALRQLPFDCGGRRLLRPQPDQPCGQPRGHAYGVFRRGAQHGGSCAPGAGHKRLLIQHLLQAAVRRCIALLEAA